MTQGGRQDTAGRRGTAHELPDVLMPAEVVDVLRLQEQPQTDGTIRRRALADALRSLGHLVRSGRIRPLPGCGRGHRFARAEVLRYLDGAPPDGVENVSVCP